MKRTLPLTAATLCCAVLCAPSVNAQSPAEGKLLRAAFDARDQDSNQTLNDREWDGPKAAFLALDRNGDDALSFAEWLKFDAARDSLQPKRPTTDPGLRKRLTLLARYDSDGNGRLTRDEWTGDPAAFAVLDVDGNDIVDARDAAALPVDSAPKQMTLPDGINRRLPSRADLLKEFDRDNDQRLSAAELRPAKALRRLVKFADTNRDGILDREELDAVIRTVNMRIAARERGYGRATAYRIPFKAWDSDKDGRLSQDEFQRRQDLFARLDRNRDAAVTEQEVERYRRSVEERGFFGRYDLDDNGKITREEFDGPAPAFNRADRNGDGVITKGDR